MNGRGSDAPTTFTPEPLSLGPADRDCGSTERVAGSAPLGSAPPERTRRGRTPSRLALPGLAAAVLLAPAAEARPAPPIRVLFLVPDGRPELAAQVARLEGRILGGESRLSLASSIGGADVLVELVGFRDGTIGSGEPMAAWYGRYLLLAEPDRPRDAPGRVRSSPAGRPQPFVLSITGKRDASAPLSLLEDFLAEALGRPEPPRSPRASPPRLPVRA